MQPRLDDALIEYSFTEEEARMAQILDPLKIAYLQTKYAQYFKLRGSIKIPESKELNMAYILQCLELDGKLTMIQELLDGHKEALKSYNNAKQNDGIQVNQTEQATAERAASQVHKIQTL